MRLSIECLYCAMRKAESLYGHIVQDYDKRISFMKKVMKLMSELDNDISAPYLYSKTMKLLSEELDNKDIYYEEKKKFNKALLSLENEIQEKVERSEDKLLTALQYAMVGNFIDFGSLDEVGMDKLLNIIDGAEKQTIDRTILFRFKDELAYSKELVYLTDNAGEIVFDKIFISIIKKLFTHLKIHVIVRGYPTLNDVTMEDAEDVGLDEIVQVTDNGTDIPGTELGQINEFSKRLVNNSDIIVAKGQGNFESLCGCNKNIYYIFLCKCDVFVNRFGLNKYEGIFANEKDLIKYRKTALL